MILEVKVGNSNWTIPLERRITILRGFSGEGKSDMVYNLSNPSQLVKVSLPIPYVVVTYTTWKSIVENTTNSLLIFDDLEEVGSCEFSRLLKETESNGNYFLLITRELVGINQERQLSIAVTSILRFKTKDGGLVHYTEPFFKFEKVSTLGFRCSTVITEDSGNGYKFFTILFSNKDVLHSDNGKSDISKKTLEVLNRIDSNILVLFDNAAFGCHMDEFVDRCCSDKVFIDLEYECFEELLLNSKLISDNCNLGDCMSNETKLNSYLSREIYYENLLKEVSKDKPFKTGHDGKLNFCWKNECKECKRNKEVKCSYYTDETKLEYLLKSTKYEKYLNID